LFSFASHAQFGNVKAETLNDIKNRKMLFIIEGNSKNDKLLLKETVKNEWSITDFSFITPKELNSYKNDSQYFFIAYQAFNYDDSFTDRTMKRDITTDGIQVFYYKNSKPKGILSVKFSPARYEFPGANDKAVEKFNKSMDRFLNIEAKYIEALNMIQNHINYFSSEDLKDGMKPKELLSYLSSKKKDRVKDKTLLFTNLTVPKRLNSEEKIKKIYDHKFKFVSIKNIEEAIINKTPNTAYFKIILFRTLTFILVIDAETSEVLYGEVGKGFDQLHIPPRVFKELN